MSVWGVREECSRSSLTSKRFSHQGKRGVPRTYSRRKVLKGIEGPSLENRMSIEGSHSGGNEKNREPKRLPMGCSGSQRGLKERKRELIAGGGPGYWQDPLFAGGGQAAGRALFSLAETPATGRKPFSLAEAPATGRTLFSLAECPGHWCRINGTNKCAGMQQRKSVRFITNNISFKRQLC